MEFFASARFKMAVPEGVQGIAGGLIIPSGIAQPVLIRRDLGKRYPHLQRRLLDPQLYLANLNGAKCRGACVNLASYGWFNVTGIDPYDSKKHSQSEWKEKAIAKIHNAWPGAVPSASKEIDKAITACVATQVVLGCEAIILPSPLTSDPSTDYSTELHWLDQGLRIAGKVAAHKARLATIALSDTCLRGIDPSANQLLELILDQVTARQPEGAYLVLELANEHGYYCSHPNTIGAVLRLVKGLKGGGLSRVFVAFAGVAGLLAVCAGADGWSTGWYRGERRLRLVDFEQPQGRANPSYYSHPLASEFHLQSDLDRVNAATFLSRVADETPASQGLLKALASSRLVSSVPDWRYSQSNVSAAIEHFLTAAARETSALATLSSEKRIEYGKQWLEGAEKLASELYAIGPFNPRTELDHQTAWRSAFEKFLASDA